MKHKYPNLVIACLVFSGLLGWTNSVSAKKTQTGRQSTPDPYFNPRKNPDAEKPATDASNKPAENRIAALTEDQLATTFEIPSTDLPPVARSTPPTSVGRTSWNTPRTPIQQQTPNSVVQSKDPNLLNRYPLNQKPKFGAAQKQVSDRTIIREVTNVASGQAQLRPLSDKAQISNDSRASGFGATTDETTKFNLAEATNRSDQNFGAYRKQAPNQSTSTQSNFGSSDFLSAGNSTAPTSSQVALPAQQPNQPIRVASNSKPVKVESRPVKAFEPTQLLAVVGGEPVFMGDIMFEVNQVIEQHLADAPESVKQTERKKLVKRILPGFVESKLMYADTLRKLPEGTKVEEILEQASGQFNEKELPKMLEQSNLKSAAELDAQLRAQGYSLRKLKTSWSQQQLAMFFLSKHLNVDTEVTHQEMLDKYRENINDYAITAKSKWEQVMIRNDRAGSRSAAKEQIVELGNQIVYGANFQAIAKKHSHGFKAHAGGQHDWTSKSALVLKEIDEAIFNLPVGELSDIIETRDGFHIVRVKERTDATRKPFLEAQVEIKKKLLAEKRNASIKKHLEKIRNEIPVEYYDF